MRMATITVHRVDVDLLRKQYFALQAVVLERLNGTSGDPLEGLMNMLDHMLEQASTIGGGVNDGSNPVIDTEREGRSS